MDRSKKIVEAEPSSPISRVDECHDCYNSLLNAYDYNADFGSVPFATHSETQQMKDSKPSYYSLLNKENYNADYGNLPFAEHLGIHQQDDPSPSLCADEPFREADTLHTSDQDTEVAFDGEHFKTHDAKSTFIQRLETHTQENIHVQSRMHDQVCNVDTLEKISEDGPPEDNISLTFTHNSHTDLVTNVEDRGFINHNSLESSFQFENLESVDGREGEYVDFYDKANAPNWLRLLLHENRYFEKCSTHVKDIKYFTYDPLLDIARYLCSKCVEGFEKPYKSYVFLQVRKCSHHNSVASDQLAEYMNVDGIFNFTINSMQVHYLRPPPRRSVNDISNTPNKQSMKELTYNQDFCEPQPAHQTKGKRELTVPSMKNVGFTRQLHLNCQQKASRSKQTTSAEPMKNCITCRRAMKERENEVVCSIECKLKAISLQIMPPHLANITSKEHERANFEELLRQCDIETKKGCLLKLVLKLAGFDASTQRPSDWRTHMLKKLENLKAKDLESRKNKEKKGDM
ncbi:hypothetical protein L7F22_061702 [Adiantum nelumboides]|nr:hypothetical protein [Adiantum nelumboides]